ncbi:MAG: SDR family NAD(P)-dependent oxidoreductase [Burkholderiaceae bacterium]
MSKHDLTILTGASRGMGLAMAHQLCVQGAVLVCISRNRSDALQSWADTRGAQLTQWTADLAEAAPTAERLRAWLSAQPQADIGRATLINNAGVVGHLGPLDTAGADDIANCMRIDLEAPLQLSAAFLAATADWQMPRRILNISSGLGRRAMSGTALYCAAKAGMDHFSRCVALDEARKPHGARIGSLAPGVIDTGMQATLRSGDPLQFPDRDQFQELKESAALASPDHAAAQVLAYLERPGFGDPVIGHVRDA